MTTASDLWSKPFIRVVDLDGKDHVVTIAAVGVVDAVDVEMIRTRRDSNAPPPTKTVPALFFREDTRYLLLNRGTTATLETLLGEIEHWPGHRITLFVTEERKRQVVRIRPTHPDAKTPTTLGLRQPVQLAPGVVLAGSMADVGKPAAPSMTTAEYEAWMAELVERADAVHLPLKARTFAPTVRGHQAKMHDVCTALQAKVGGAEEAARIRRGDLTTEEELQVIHEMEASWLTEEDVAAQLRAEQGALLGEE